MRQTRNKEAAALLAGRGSEAKKVFQRNSSQGQMNFGAALRKSSDPKPLPGVTGVSKASPPVKPVAEPLKEESKPEPEPESESEPANDIAPPPPAFDGSPEPVETKQEDPQVHLHHASPANISASNQEEEEETELPQASSPNMESYGTCAVALYDYQVSLRSLSPLTFIMILSGG